MPDQIDGQVTVVYIHGAGRQPDAATLRKNFDTALFGGECLSIALRYAQVIWGDDVLDDRDGELESIAADGGSPDDSADRVWNLLVETVGPAIDDSGASEEAGKSMVGRWFAAALDLERRRVAAFDGYDVLAYLAFGKADEMQKPVFDGFQAIPDPVVVISHSLGTILTYDVLRRADFPHRQVRLLATAGSPLGLPFVHMTRRNGPGPNPLGWIPTWPNFADPDDVVCKFDMTLADDYSPTPPAIQDMPGIINGRPNHHDLEGYLAIPSFRDAVVAARGIDDCPTQ